MPEPGPGEVRVRMIASPINPSDLLVVRGRYGVLPRLPATPGFEGVGVVDKAGPGLLGRWAAGQAGGRDQLGRGATGPSTPSSRPGRPGRSRPTSPTSRRRPSSSTRRPCWPWSGTS